MRISDEIISRLIEAYRKIRNTCRFLLGNISDLDPSLADTKKLNPHDLDEIDQYIMSILQRLIERVNRAYENFSFHEVYHSIYNFCVVDMSSFYLDILKDRLYTFKKDSALRRSSQIVLYNVLISITKMIAPILSFTAEEIWSHLPGKKEESVFLSTFPEVDERFINPELEETWKRLIRIRDEVNKALEIKRKEKYIGNSLEAGVILLTEKEEIINLLERYRDFLPTLFIVSSVEVNPPNPEGDVYESEEITGLRICVTKAKGSKCQRCWNWDESVGTYNEYPDVCTKCYQVLTTS
jgi:isoleucyl-tRNA synthetase